MEGATEKGADPFGADARLSQNFQETAFFSAMLKSDKKGNVRVHFSHDERTGYVILVMCYEPKEVQEYFASGRFRPFHPSL